MRASALPPIRPIERIVYGAIGLNVRIRPNDANTCFRYVIKDERLVRRGYVTVFGERTPTPGFLDHLKRRFRTSVAVDWWPNWAD